MNKNVSRLSTRVHVDQKDLTEREFFKRELSFNLVYVSPSNSDQIHPESNGLIWIASTDPKKWLSFLMNTSQNQVVFLFLGNELYNLESLEYLRGCSSIKKLFMYSPMRSPSTNNLVSSFLGALMDSGIHFFEDVKTYLRNFRTGLQVKNRLKDNEMKFGSILEIPQGYSTAFVSQLCRRITNLEKDSSLLDNLHLIDAFTAVQRFLFDFTFVGQSGTLRRKRFIQAALSSKNVNVHTLIRDGFAGHKDEIDTQYIDNSLASRSVLIPPGLFNNYNHRYCESLILSRMPVILCNNITDPNSSGHWTRRLPFAFRDSAKYIIHHIKSLSPESYSTIIENARMAEFNKVNTFRREIWALSGQEHIL